MSECKHEFIYQTMQVPVCKYCEDSASFLEAEEMNYRIVALESQLSTLTAQLAAAEAVCEALTRWKEYTKLFDAIQKCPDCRKLFRGSYEPCDKHISNNESHDYKGDVFYALSAWQQSKEGK